MTVETAHALLPRTLHCVGGRVDGGTTTALKFHLGLAKHLSFRGRHTTGSFSQDSTLLSRSGVEKNPFLSRSSFLVVKRLFLYTFMYLVM